MSGTRRFIGFWLALILFAVVFPCMFYLTSRLVDTTLELSPVIPEPYNAFGAGLAFVIGIFWISWAYAYIHFLGQGSPIEAFGTALEPTQMLVTTGPYAFTRNPMILGLIFVFIGIAVYMRSLGGLVSLPVIAALFVLYIKAFEEPALAQRFGEAYDEYRRSVRVLIPWPSATTHRR